MEKTKICDALRWCVSQVFLVREAINNTPEALLLQCPYDDWDDHQKATFSALFNHPPAYAIVNTWWIVYDTLRAMGVITDASPEAAWEPLE